MLPLVVSAEVLLADPARLVSRKEYAQVMLQQVAWHEPVNPQGSRILFQ